MEGRKSLENDGHGTRGLLRRRGNSRSPPRKVGLPVSSLYVHSSRASVRPSSVLRRSHSPCHEWQHTGQCAYGYFCKFFHDSSVHKSSARDDICWEFRDSGKCRFGESCKFVHDAKHARGPASIYYRDPTHPQGTSGYHKENNHFRRREYQKKIEAERRGGYLFLCSNKKRRESSRSLSPRGGRKNKRKSSRSPLGRIVTRRKGIGGCRSSPVSSSSHTRASKAEVAVGANTPYYSPQDTLPSYDRTRRRCDECYLFRDHGFCKYGDRCKFYHDNTTATMPKSISTMRGGYRRRKRSNSRERRRMKSRDRSYDGRTVNFREISLFSTDRGGSGRKGDDMRRIRSRRTNNSKSDIYSINGNDHKNGDTRGEDKKNILHHNTKRIGNGLQPDYSSCTSTISPEIIKENVLAAASKRLNGKEKDM